MTPHEITRALHEAIRLNLSGWELLLDTDRAVAECNGIGAAWMGKLCKIFDFLLPSLVTASAIHDMRYFQNKNDRHLWDDEFENNCRIIIRDKYRWYHPGRYIAFYLAHKLRIALYIGGEFAWNQAKGKNKNDNA